jgi:hypothetical protein
MVRDERAEQKKMRLSDGCEIVTHFPVKKSIALKVAGASCADATAAKTIATANKERANDMVDGVMAASN